METWGRVAALALSGLLLVAGCGDDDGAGVDDARSSDVGSTEAGDVDGNVDDGSGDGGAGADEYVTELSDGSRLRVRLDVPADDPAVAPFEELRALTGVDEPTWIVARVAVPEGVDGTGRFLTFVEPGADPLDDDPIDPDDGVSQATFACSVLDDWFAAAPEPDDALNEVHFGLLDGPCGQQTAQVLAPAGETTTYVLVYEGELPDFERVEAELGNELMAA